MPSIKSNVSTPLGKAVETIKATSAFAARLLSRSLGFRGGGGGGRRSDIELKHDVVLLGHLANGLGYYRFSYLGSSEPYVGVIAQEVQSLVPEGVTRGHDGYLRVYYGQLGLKLRSYTDWLAGGAKIPTPAEVLP